MVRMQTMPISVLGNYNGMPSKIVTALQGIKDKLGNGVEVVYEKAINFTNDTLLRLLRHNSKCSWEGKKGFYAEYFNNRDLKGEPSAYTNGRRHLITTGRKDNTLLTI